MNIVSSQLSIETPQEDGRTWVREQHTLDTGEVMEFYYLADADADVNAIMQERAAALSGG